MTLVAVKITELNGSIKYICCSFTVETSSYAQSLEKDGSISINSWYEYLGSLVVKIFTQKQKQTMFCNYWLIDY